MNDPDQLYTGKSIYDVSKSEIFWRNFLAGFARGLGNFLFTIIMFVIITMLTAQFLMPFVNPIFNSLNSLNGIMGTINRTQTNSFR